MKLFSVTVSTRDDDAIHLGSVRFLILLFTLTTCASVIWTVAARGQDGFDTALPRQV